MSKFMAIEESQWSKDATGAIHNKRAFGEIIPHVFEDKVLLIFKSIGTQRSMCLQRHVVFKR